MHLRMDRGGSGGEVGALRSMVTSLVALQAVGLFGVLVFQSFKTLKIQGKGKSEKAAGGHGPF